MSRASSGDSGATATKVRVNELELDLSLGHGVRRIITAEDFPSLMSQESPISSNSSVSSSSVGLGDDTYVGDGGGNYSRVDAIGCNRVRLGNSPSHSQVVGWPPIRTCRRNNLVSLSRVANSDAKAAIHKEISQCCSSNATKKDNGGNDGERNAVHAQKSHFVKVNMDGDPIGRKVDLHAHVSYEALALVLEAMFHKPDLLLNASTNGLVSKLLDGSSEYVLIYEDEEGDWMLVGDVPWGMFLRTARRLRIMKTVDACGLDGPVHASPIIFRTTKYRL